MMLRLLRQLFCLLGSTVCGAGYARERLDGRFHLEPLYFLK
jgi:hypothetical protein